MAVVQELSSADAHIINGAAQKCGKGFTGRSPRMMREAKVDGLMASCSQSPQRSGTRVRPPGPSNGAGAASLNSPAHHALTRTRQQRTCARLCRASALSP